MKNESSSNIVIHKKYGIGKILQKRLGGFKVLVKFNDGIERWVRFNTIKSIDVNEERDINKSQESAVGPDKDSNSAYKEAYSVTDKHIEKGKSPTNVNKDEWFKARCIIESLRLGIVPQGYIQDFTIGRDNEIKKFEKYLLDDKPIIIEGEYGSGKTHFIEYAYSYALNNNWAVATINIDSQETALNKPKSIYRSIVKSFAFRKKNGGFENFLKEIAGSEKRIKLRDNAFLMRVIDIIDRETDDDFWEYMDGKTDTRYMGLPKLPDTATAANLYINIISGISWASRNVLNKNGLILFFDEAESLDESFLYSYYRKKRDKDFLKGLIGVVSNDERLLREYPATDGISRAKIGEETGLRYYGHKITINRENYGFVRFAWKLPSYLKAVFAFTPGSETVSNILSDANKIVLDYLDESELMRIADRLRHIYENAYNFHPDKLDGYNLIVGEGQTRLSIKRFVEKMDIKRFNVSQ